MGVGHQERKKREKKKTPSLLSYLLRQEVDRRRAVHRCLLHAGDDVHEVDLVAGAEET